MRGKSSLITTRFTLSLQLFLSMSFLLHYHDWFFLLLLPTEECEGSPWFHWQWRRMTPITIRSKVPWLRIIPLINNCDVYQLDLIVNYYLIMRELLSLLILINRSDWREEEGDNTSSPWEKLFQGNNTWWTDQLLMMSDMISDEDDHLWRSWRQWIFILLMMRHTIKDRHYVTGSWRIGYV